MIKSLVKLDYRNIFVLTFISGTIFIVLGWLLNSPYICGVVLPILCMLTYSSLGFIEKKNDTLIEQFADSIYYLGFLLTLVALIVSLIVLSEKEYSLEGVGSRFGIALATTVLGLFLRIVLTNFRETFSDKRVIVEEQLTKSMKDFSYQVIIHAETLRTTTELYNNSIELSINSMNKSIAILTSGLDSVSTKGLEHVAKTFEETNKKISLAVNNLFKKIELIQISEDILTSPIQEPIKQLANLLDEYKDGFASVTQEQKNISSDNKLFSDNLTKLNQSANKLDNSIDKTVSTIDKLSSALSAIGDVEPNIQSVVKSIVDIDKESQKLTNTIKNHEEVVSNIDGISNSHLNMVKRHQSDIEEIMKKSRINLDLLNESLIKSVQFITNELGRGSGGGSK